MRLLDRGPHTVTVTPRIRTLDEANAPVWGEGVPVEVPGGMMQPLSSTESAPLTGAAVTNAWRWYGAAPWPGGPHSRVSWQGREFDQVGSAQEYSCGIATHHISVLLQERAPSSR